MLAARPLGLGARLAKAAGLLAVLVAVAAGGPLVDAALLAPAGPALQVTPEAELVALGRDRLARRFAYRGQFEGPGRHGGLAGEVTTVVSPIGTGVVFDAWAEADVYPYERGDAGVMVARAVVG